MFSLSHPFVFVLAYLAVLYIRPHEFVEALKGVSILPVLLGLSLLMWLRQPGKVLTAPQHRLVPVLYFFLVFSVLLTGWMGGAVKAVGDFLPTLLLFMMLSTAIDSLERMRVVYVLLAACGGMMSVHGHYQAMSESGIGWTGAEMIQRRITYLGFLNDPNDLAMALLMAMPMALYVASTTSSWLLRWALRISAALSVYAVYLTNSRGGLLSLGVMGVMYSILRYGPWRGLLVLPVLGTALVLFAPSRGAEISADEESAAGRVEAWYEGFQMLMGHPLFGVGYNMFIEHHIRTAHNSYVLVIAELGILGYFVWLSIIVLTTMMLLQIERMDAPRPNMPPEEAARWQALHGASRALLYGMVGGLMASMFLSRSYTVIWYVHIGLVVAMYQLIRRQWPMIEPITFSKYWGRLFAFSNATVFIFWLLTRVLL